MLVLYLYLHILLDNKSLCFMAVLTEAHPNNELNLTSMFVLPTPTLSGVISYISRVLARDFGSVAGWTGPRRIQSALYSQTCTLEPMSSEVDFVLLLLRVTYVQVPLQGNQH